MESSDITMYKFPSGGVRGGGTSPYKYTGMCSPRVFKLFWHENGCLFPFLDLIIKVLTHIKILRLCF